jgi:hypothetical protein
MAINVNTVYQTVLLILNKEQRGYMTPVEFNKTGAQAQLDIFETYFDSLNQQIRVPQTDADYSNRVVSLDEKLSIFKEFGNATSISSSNVFNLPQQFSGSGSIATTTLPAATASATTAYVIQTATADQITNGVVEVFANGVLLSDTLYSISGTTINFFSQPTTGQTLIVNIYPKQFYKLGQVLYKPSSFPIAEELQRVLREELYHLLKSDLTVPSTTNPIYLYENSQLTVYPTTIVDDIEVAYVRKPIAPIWNFTAGLNNQYIFNASTSFNFELHSAEQTELILKILLYAGVVVKSPEIVQVAAQQVAQENINQQR